MRDTAKVIGLAAVLGIASGFVWFRLGDRMEAHIGNFAAWYVCPAVVPLAIAVLLVARTASATTVNRTRNALLFFAVYYLVHWWPVGAMYLLAFAGFPPG